MAWGDEIKVFFHGDVSSDEATLEKFSRDYSVFQVVPQVVVFPKDVDDVKNLVKFVAKKKSAGEDISLTGRSPTGCVRPVPREGGKCHRRDYRRARCLFSGPRKTIDVARPLVSAISGFERSLRARRHGEQQLRRREDIGVRQNGRLRPLIERCLGGRGGPCFAASLGRRVAGQTQGTRFRG